MTLAGDPGGVLPLCAGARVLLAVPKSEAMTLADTTGGQEVVLGEALREHGFAVRSLLVSLDVEAAEREAVLAAAASDEVDVVVLGCINAWRFAAQAALGRELQALGRPLVAVALRDPYDLTLLPPGATALATCSTQPVMMKALAAVLAGVAQAEGRLPVTLAV